VTGEGEGGKSEKIPNRAAKEESREKRGEGVGQKQKGEETLPEDNPQIKHSWKKVEKKRGKKGGALPEDNPQIEHSRKKLGRSRGGGGGNSP
jgi:hypothetical protein